MLNIVLHQPEIPMNTGNIARSCAATGARLHLIHPLGFDISDKAVKRAGLDYWHLVDISQYGDLDEFFSRNPAPDMWLLSTKAPRSYTQAGFKEDSFLFFGRETKGLPEPFLKEHLERCVRIPMRPQARSLNLSNSVAIVLYEALRQLDFGPELETGGHFPGND